MKALKLLVVTGLLALGAGAGSAASAGDAHWQYEATAVHGEYLPLVGDFAGDQADDIFWYAPGSAADVLWVPHAGSRGSDSFSHVPLRVSGTYRPIVGDFVGDDYDDILWYRPGTGADFLWESVPSGDAFVDAGQVPVSGDYRPEVLRDYRDGAHKDAVVWQRTTDGPDALWRFDADGEGGWTSEGLEIGARLTLLPGDFDGDGLDDLVLYGPGSLPDGVWLIHPDQGFTRSPLAINGRYQAVTVIGAARDGVFLFGDGSAPDWYLRSDGAALASELLEPFGTVGEAHGADARGFAFVHSTSPGVREAGLLVDDGPGRRFTLSETHDVGAGVRPVTGDLDDDGTVDILWYGPGSRPDELWYAESLA